MAGGRPQYRHLSRKSSHRVAMLRNMVTSLIEHEQITTTWHKAKEVQRIADKLITLAKRNTNATQRRAHQILFQPHRLVPKLFGPIRDRYLTRPGGYTRVLRIEPVKNDHASSAILELVGNPQDMRFACTALTLARLRADSLPLTPITQMNVRKATAFDLAAPQRMKDLVDELEAMDLLGVKKDYISPPKKLFVGHGRKNFREAEARERKKEGKPALPRTKPKKLLNRAWKVRFARADQKKENLVRHRLVLAQQREAKGQRQTAQLEVDAGAEPPRVTV